MEQIGLSFGNNKVSYIPRPNIGKIRFQRAFMLDVNQIKIIGLTPKLILDEEELFVTFVDSNASLYHISSFEFADEAWEKITALFSIKVDWEKYKWEDFEKGESIILYPQSFAGCNLFQKENWSLDSVFRKLQKLFLINHIANGVLSNKAKDILLKEKLS